MNELERFEKFLTDLSPGEFLDLLKRIEKSYASYRILTDSEPPHVDIGASRKPVLFDDFRTRVIEQVRTWKQTESSHFEDALRAAGVRTDESLRLEAELRALNAAEKAAESAEKSNAIASEANRIAAKSSVIAVLALCVSVVAAIVAVASLID